MPAALEKDADLSTATDEARITDSTSMPLAEELEDCLRAEAMSKGRHVMAFTQKLEQGAVHPCGFKTHSHYLQGLVELNEEAARQLKEGSQVQPGSHQWTGGGSMQQILYSLLKRLAYFRVLPTCLCTIDLTWLCPHASAAPHIVTGFSYLLHLVSLVCSLKLHLILIVFLFRSTSSSEPCHEEHQVHAHADSPATMDSLQEGWTPHSKCISIKG
jgi:hypothetical protein